MGTETRKNVNLIDEPLNNFQDEFFRFKAFTLTRHFYKHSDNIPSKVNYSPQAGMAQAQH